MRAVDIGALVINPKSTCRDVSRVVVKMRSLDLGNLPPRRNFLRSQIAPVFAAVACAPDLAIIGSCPDGVDVLEGRSQRVNHTPLFRGVRVFGNEVADTWGYARIGSRQVWTDRLPVLAAVCRFEEVVRRVIHRMRI